MDRKDTRAIHLHYGELTKQTAQNVLWRQRHLQVHTNRLIPNFVVVFVLDVLPYPDSVLATTFYSKATKLGYILEKDAVDMFVERSKLLQTN